MKKKLGLGSIVLLAINSIIGSGIFLSPGSVIAMSGTKAPMVYGLAAIFAIILAVTFATAAKYVTQSGAAYAYTRTAFGNDLGFYVGITRYLAATIAWGVMATGVIKTTISLLGGDSNNFNLITLGFVLLMLLLLIINFLGSQIFIIINNLATLGKLLALLTVIVAGIYLITTTGVNHFNAINNVKDTSGKPLVPVMNTANWVTAIIAAFYAFTGFEGVASGTEDMHNPQKNLPRAIPLAISVIALIYIGIIIVVMMINPQAIVQTKSVVALAAVFHNPIIKNIILSGALISMLGVNVAASFHTPRALEAMAKQKQIPRWLQKRTRHNFPLSAFLITVSLALIIPLVFNYNMTNIIILSSISRFVQFLVVPLSVINYFRGKNKEAVLPNVQKNIVTDVIFPVLAVLLTLFLLLKFDWVGQFTVIDTQGQRQPNIAAIIVMILGYVILPGILYGFYRKTTAQH